MDDSTETKLAETKTRPATDFVGSEAESGSKEVSATDIKTSVADMASSAASTAAAAAAGVKDSMFSMFGGGTNKEKKVEEEEDEDAKNEPSGSSKAQKKNADAEVWI